MRFRIHSCVLLTLVFLLALTACSVETREERQQRLGQENGQVADQPGETAQDGGAQDGGAQDSGAAPGAAVDAAPDTTPDATPDTTPDTTPDAGSDATPDAAAPHGQDAAAPDAAVDAAPDALTQGGTEMPMPPVSEPDSGLYDMAMEALDQHPEAVVHAFFTQVMNGDLASLEPLVAKDQRQGLKDLLAYLEEQKNLPEDSLQGVDKVDVMQTTLTAVVDVNVTVRLESGPRTTAESIELVYEDGAWRLSNLDF